MAVRVYPAVNAESLHRLLDEIGEDQFNKAMVRMLREMQRDVKRKSKAEVLDNYSLPASMYASKVNLTIRPESTGMLLTYKGRRLKLYDFLSDAGPPIVVDVKKNPKAIQDSEYVNLNNVFVDSTKHHMIFERLPGQYTGKSLGRIAQTGKGKKVEKLRGLTTVGIPQMILNPEVSTGIIDFALDEMQRAAEKFVDRSFKKAKKG